MSQVEVAKLSAYVAMVPPADAVTVTKMSVYVWLMPGDDSGDVPERRSHCYAQRFGRG